MPAPTYPAPSKWHFPQTAAEQATAAGTDEVVGIGADLEPGTLLEAYRCGLFPMPAGKHLAWWSPDPRGVLPLDGLVMSRSLRRSCRRYTVSFDSAFPEVVACCAEVCRAGGWISPAIRNAYIRLHELGWAHSVEAWTPEGELAGGLYGVAIGGLFAGESMFYRERDASKVALVALVGALRDGGAVLLDVQWLTPHLERLGAVALSRSAYHKLLREAIERPQLSLSPSPWQPAHADADQPARRG